MYISFSAAKELIIPALKKKGFSPDESEIIYSTLLWAQKRGSSQGFNKLFGWRFDKNPSAASPKIIKSTPTSLQIDAGLNSNILAVNLAVDEILKNTSAGSVNVAGINNADNSCGALGYYAEKLAQNNFVSIIMAAADPGVSAFGGTRPIFGTNPISISVPSEPHPIILDMSTAALTWGDLIKYHTAGKPLPEGVAFDDQGQPTTDPEKAMDGWVATFDRSYKSSGLALMIQILAGPMVGSIYSPDFNHCQYGTLIIALKSDTFGDASLFSTRIKELLNDVKSTDKDIFAPGEQGFRRSAAADARGQIEIEDGLYRKINEFLEK